MARGRDDFRASYQALVGAANLDRELVQLGVPGSDRVVVWYAHAAGATPDSVRGRASVELDGTMLGDEAVTRYAGPAGVATGRIEIGNLDAGRAVSVRVRLTPTGDRHLLDARTAPAADDRSSFSFLAYSCFSPFEPGLVRQRTVNALALAARRATAPDRPSFALATGDQVYVDAGAKPTQLFGGAELDLLGGATSSRRLYQKGDAPAFFDTLYRAYFAIPPYDRMLRLIPTCMTWDDHDIRDGWGSHGDEDEAEWREHYRAARRWFLAFQALRNTSPGGDHSGRGASPATAESRQLVEGPPTEMPEFYHSFCWGRLASVFIMDLRSRRSIGPKASGAWPDARVISEDQVEAVRSWLDTPGWRDEPKVFVLVSSMPLAHEKGTNPVEWRLWFRRDDRLDNWWSEAAVSTRDRLVAAIVDHFRAHRQHRLVVVSGDVHFSEVLELAFDEGGQRTVFGHEVVSSGLAQAHFYATTGDRAKSQGWTTIGAGKAALLARGRGRLLAPSFAEISIREPADPATPPQVAVRFAEVAAREKGRLIGIDARAGGTWPEFTMLPLEPTDARFPFPDEPAAGADWDAIAPGWG